MDDVVLPRGGALVRRHGDDVEVASEMRAPRRERAGRQHRDAALLSEVSVEQSRERTFGDLREERPERFGARLGYWVPAVNDKERLLLPARETHERVDGLRVRGFAGRRPLGEEIEELDPVREDIAQPARERGDRQQQA